MTPEYRKTTGFGDSKERSEDEDSLVLSREVTPEYEDVDNLMFATEVTPEHEGELLLDNPVFSREVSPDAECEQVSVWVDIEASSGAFVEQQSQLSSGEVSPEPTWEQPSLPSSTEVATKLITYYTPQASDPDFDYIPLHEKRPAVSEHDRNHAEADDWKTIASHEEFDSDIRAKITAGDGTVIYRKPPYQILLSEEVCITLVLVSQWHNNDSDV